MKPKPPSWFVKKLRMIDATLGVRHSGPQGWQITQEVPWVKDHGVWRGGRLLELTKRKEHVGYYSGLGSSILYELPRHNTARYRGFEEFCQELNIRY